MEEWITALIAFFGVILGAGIQEFRRWRESREKYQVMIFPRRLETHQKAFEWCQKLNVELNRGVASGIHECATKFREWWDANCFYLDPKSRKEIIPLINYAHWYARNHKKGEVWEYLDKAIEAVTKGIGFEYLPESLRERKSKR